MNERIRKLVEQAGIPTIDGVWDYNDRNILVKNGNEWRSAVPSEIIGTMIDSEKGLEKFAELIVRECAEVCRNQPNHYAQKADRDNCAIAIEEHFGVEE